MQEVVPGKQNVRAACPKDKLEFKFFSSPGFYWHFFKFSELTLFFLYFFWLCINNVRKEVSKQVQSKTEQGQTLIFLYWIEVCDVVITATKKCLEFLFCLSECEQHYLECYINAPGKALQIPGTINSSPLSLLQDFSLIQCFSIAQLQ